MKKTYINPEMEVVILQAKTTLLAGSDQNVGIGDPYSGGGVGSREDDSDYDW